MSERLAIWSGGLSPVRGREAPCTPVPTYHRAERHTSVQRSDEACRGVGGAKPLD